MTSIMHIDVPRPPQAILKKITGNTVVDIVDAAENPKWVPWFEVNENAGGTQNLTVVITDGTTNIYPAADGTLTAYNVKAVTAAQSLKFKAGYVIPKSFKLRVTSSDAAGKFDVLGVVIDFA